MCEQVRVVPYSVWYWSIVQVQDNLHECIHCDAHGHFSAFAWNPACRDCGGAGEVYWQQDPEDEDGGEWIPVGHENYIADIAGQMSRLCDIKDWDCWSALCNFVKGVRRG